MIIKRKRGFELAISTLIILVLAVLVLLAIVIGFTGGFSKFWNYVSNFFPSDIQAIKSACQNSCDLGQNYDFCIRERNAGSLGDISCNNPVLNISCKNINC